ncbi:MAG: hypothetical protein M3P85_15215 [Actinomycetota bacterium]|nr:hypothetical protein [Actinomycetota bacterium]
MTEPTTPAGPPTRLPLMLGVGAGLLLLIFLSTQILSGDDDSEPPATPLPSPVPSTVAIPTTISPGAAPVETFETFNTKNPFVPLRIVGGGGSGAAPAGGAPPAGGSPPATTRPGGTTTGATGGSGATGGAGGARTGGGRNEPLRGARVALLDVFTDDGKTVANVRVNDTVYKVTAGQVFATNFKAVSISQADGCGRFIFGDDAFRLCKGEETLK